MEITTIWRHPIKSHGREALDRVSLFEGRSMPYDRLWAIAHDAAKTDGSAWAACGNFSNGSKTPALMAITATLDESAQTVTLHHPDRPDLTVQPCSEADKLLDWVRPLCDPNRAMPAQVYKLEERGFTDTPFASISLHNIASHTAVETIAGTALQPERWRGNFWFKGASPWQEFDWIGHEMQLGTARIKVVDRIKRCMATTANTDTGLRDVDTLKALNSLDHQDFGIYATVIQSGTVAVGDQLELI